MEGREITPGPHRKELWDRCVSINEITELFRIGVQRAYGQLPEEVARRKHNLKWREYDVDVPERRGRIWDYAFPNELQFQPLVAE